jgi:hypothetical protein
MIRSWQLTNMSLSRLSRDFATAMCSRGLKLQLVFLRVLIVCSTCIGSTKAFYDMKMNEGVNSRSLGQLMERLKMDR